MRVDVKLNSFVLTEIAASMLLAACGGATSNDNNSAAIPLAANANAGGTGATESSRPPRSTTMSWSFCAPEGGSCRVAGNTQIRYGAQGRFIFNLFASVAEFERDIIRERTQEGLSASWTRGRKGGRPKGLSLEARLKAGMRRNFTPTKL